MKIKVCFEQQEKCLGRSFSQHKFSFNSPLRWFHTRKEPEFLILEWHWIELLVSTDMCSFSSILVKPKSCSKNEKLSVQQVNYKSTKDTFLFVSWIHIGKVIFNMYGSFREKKKPLLTLPSYFSSLVTDLCTCTQQIFFDMWKGHRLEVRCTNIRLKIFIK